MPIFEYRCVACGAEFEHLVLKSSPVLTCPSCENEAVERIMSINSVSSDHTRRRASRAIRARNQALRKDHAHEEVKRIESHARDHDD